MSNIDKELKDILDEEQNSIIKSVEKYIMVSACPGAGKTYTIVRKIEKELEYEEYPPELLMEGNWAIRNSPCVNKKRKEFFEKYKKDNFRDIFIEYFENCE